MTYGLRCSRKSLPPRPWLRAAVTCHRCGDASAQALSSRAFAVAAGCHPKLPTQRFKGPDYVYPGYSYTPWTELARLLVSLAPRPLTTCLRATGGSEAVDLALQGAMIHTGRRAFLSLEGSYH